MRVEGQMFPLLSPDLYPKHGVDLVRHSRMVMDRWWIIESVVWKGVRKSMASVRQISTGDAFLPKHSKGTDV